MPKKRQRFPSAFSSVLAWTVDENVSKIMRFHTTGENNTENARVGENILLRFRRDEHGAVVRALIVLRRIAPGTQWLLNASLRSRNKNDVRAWRIPLLCMKPSVHDSNTRGKG